jgi:nitroreductase
MDVLEAIKNRRSIRRYQKEQITPKERDLILEAGRFAPSGGNNQTTHFLVIQKEEILTRLKLLAEQEFAKMELLPGMYKSLENSIRQSKAGGYDFLYGAPTLVLTANRKGYGNAVADCAAALENMMLAACALGIGSCWINQIRWLNENPVILDYLTELGLAGNELVWGGLALGYPAQQPGKLARHGNPVTILE